MKLRTPVYQIAIISLLVQLLLLPQSTL
jgi:hypothetical protein